MDERRIVLGALPDGRRVYLGGSGGSWPASGAMLLISGDATGGGGRTYLDGIIKQLCLTSGTHVIDLVGGDYSWMLEGLRTLSRSMGEGCMKIGEVGVGMHDDPRGTTVIVNGAELLYADAHEYSSLLAGKLDALMASQLRGGVSLVLAGRDVEVSRLLVNGFDGAHRIQLGRYDHEQAPEYLRGVAADVVVPSGLAAYEEPFGSSSVLFNPLPVSDDDPPGRDDVIELPIGTTGAVFSTASARNLMVHGGTCQERQSLVASMARTARKSGHDCWAATAAADSPASADWRHHRQGMATGAVQALELLRHISHELLPRIDACRAMGIDDYRNPGLPSALRRPVVLFIDDLDGLTRWEENEDVTLSDARAAIKTLVGFLAQTAGLTGLTLVVGSESGGTRPAAGDGQLQAHSAQLLLAPSTPEMREAIFGHDLPPGTTPSDSVIYRATPGTPAVAL